MGLQRIYCFLILVIKCKFFTPLNGILAGSEPFCYKCASRDPAWTEAHKLENSELTDWCFRREKGNIIPMVKSSKPL